VRTTAEYNKALEIATAVINKWDAYGLIAGGAAADEFESQISTIVTQIPRMRSPEDAAQVISDAFSKAFDHELFTPRHCKEVGAELYEQLIRAGLLRRVGSGGHLLDRVRDWVRGLFKS
jgi:hypothetical protein